MTRYQEKRHDGSTCHSPLATRYPSLNCNEDPLPHRSSCPASRRADRRSAGLADRPARVARRDHRRHGGFGGRILPGVPRRACGPHFQRAALHLDHQRRRHDATRFPDRQAVGHDDAGRHFRVADGACLHHRLHGRRSRLPALLQLHLAVHVLDADAGDEQQLPAAVLRLGSGGAGVLSADRLLVHPSDRDLRQPEGLHGQPGRRSRLPARHRADPGLFRHARLRKSVCHGAGAGDTRRSAWPSPTGR